MFDSAVVAQPAEIDATPPKSRSKWSWLQWFSYNSQHRAFLINASKGFVFVTFIGSKEPLREALVAHSTINKLDLNAARRLQTQLAEAIEKAEKDGDDDNE